MLGDGSSSSTTAAFFGWLERLKASAAENESAAPSTVTASQALEAGAGAAEAPRARCER